MSRLKKLFISPFTYEVRWHEGLSAVAGVLGAANCDEAVIIMETQQAPAVAMETLLHESLHAMWTQTALDHIYTTDQEEQIIYTMSPRIVALLRDNPAFVKALTQKGQP